MIHLKTWDIFSTKHPKFLFFVFNLFEDFLKFHFDLILVFFFDLLNPLWFLFENPLCISVFLNFHFEIPHWFPLDFLFDSSWFHFEFHVDLLISTWVFQAKNKKHRQQKQQAKQQTNSKQSSKSRTKDSLAWMLISTWFHFDFLRSSFKSSFISEFPQATKKSKKTASRAESQSSTNKKDKQNSKQSKSSKKTEQHKQNKQNQNKQKQQSEQTKKAKTSTGNKKSKRTASKAEAEQKSLAWMPTRFLTGTLISRKHPKLINSPKTYLDELRWHS
jgi:hypothetical protein